METNKILSADLLDIIFEGKNKDYGAYELRKTYNRRITTAVIIMVALVLAVFIASAIARKIEEMDAANVIAVKDLELEQAPPPARVLP